MHSGPETWIYKSANGGGKRARLMGLQMVVMVKHIHIFRLGGGVVLENALTLKLIYI